MLSILSCVDNIVHKMIDLMVTIGQGHNNVYEFILFQSFFSDVHQSKDFKIIVWKKKIPSKDLIKKIKVEKITTEHLSVVSLSFDSGLKFPCQIIFMI